AVDAVPTAGGRLGGRARALGRPGAEDDGALRPGDLRPGDGPPGDHAGGPRTRVRHDGWPPAPRRAGAGPVVRLADAAGPRPLPDAGGGLVPVRVGRPPRR